MRTGPAVDQREIKERTSIPDVGFCSEKQQLLEQFLNAVKEIGRLQQQQMNAVLRGEAFERSEGDLHDASQRKDAAKYELLAHIESHHC